MSEPSKDFYLTFTRQDGQAFVLWTASLRAVLKAAGRARQLGGLGVRIGMDTRPLGARMVE